MNLYLIEQNRNIGPNTYQSAVVCASSAEEAKNTHPNGCKWIDGSWKDQNGVSFNDWHKQWTNNPSRVKVLYLGVASHQLKLGVITFRYQP